MIDPHLILKIPKSRHPVLDMGTSLKRYLYLPDYRVKPGNEEMVSAGRLL